MSVVKMSVHRGLAELKLYANKIEAVQRASFVVANKKSNDVIGGLSIDDVTKKIKGNFDSIVSLIENRKRVKDALVKSNATTLVTIGNKTMTVAEAIERKAGLVFDKNFLSVLQNQFVQQNNLVERENNNLSTRLETFLQSTLGEKRTVEDVKSLTATFESKNKFELIDPNHIQEYIAKLNAEIVTFESNVDYVLSESNATTFFEVELVD